MLNGNKKVAIEIETGKSYALQNIHRALEANFDEVICVATNRLVEDKIRRELINKGIKDENVKVTSVFGFDV